MTIKGLWKRLRALFNSDAVEREMDAELRFHLEKATEQNIALGMSPEAARRKAVLDFGGVENVREAHRDARGVRIIEDVLADTRYALRGLAHNPAFAAAAILTLALGVAANTAIFSVVNAVILRPLPFPNASQLVMLAEDNKEKAWVQQSAAPANMLDWGERVRAFVGVMAYTDGGQRTLTGQGDPKLLLTSEVTGGFFSVLGVRAAQGRILDSVETWQGHVPVVVISDGAWRNRFGSDAGIVGKSIQLDGVATQVVGVMPQDFAYPAANIEVWRPMGWDPAARAQIWFRRAHWLRVVARIKPGLALADADAQFQTVVHQLQAEYPVTNRVMLADMTPLHDFLVGSVRRPLFILLGSVAVLLIIACANVGNLLLVRALGREREAALRLALGAGRGRLIQQAITESLVLSLLGGTVGAALGWAGTRALSALQPRGVLPTRDVPVDWRLLVFVLLVSIVSGLLFGLMPALWRARRSPNEVLKDGGRQGSQGIALRRMGGVLVSAEVALALLLGTGAGLLVRSFWRLQQVDPGFDPQGVITVAMNLPQARYDSAAKIVNFYQALETKTRALPGVTGGAAVTQAPLTTPGWTSDYHVGGRPTDEYGLEVAHRTISPGYFRVMRVPLKAGRFFTDEDRGGTPRVVIINEALARESFAHANPVGQLITFNKVVDSSSIWYTIVGVVGSEHQSSLSRRPMTEIFAPFAQQPNSFMTLVARTPQDPGTLEPAIRHAVTELDPLLAISFVRTMDAVYKGSLGTERYFMTLLIAFAAVGLLLALVGVYGVIAQAARRRTREIGIRLALGAGTGEIQWLVVRYGLRLVAAGLVVGALASLLTTRVMGRLLFEVAPTDPVTFGTVAALLALAAVVATWLPAARASRTDPARTLREE